MRSRFSKKLGVVMRPFRRLRTYSPRDRRRLVWLMGQIVRVDVLLRLHGLQATRKRLARQQPALGLFSDLAPTESARFIAAAARYTLGTKNSCLRRSLLLWWLLDKQGVACDLRMGLRKTDDKLQGHAWIEIGGEVINDSVDVIATYDRFRLSAADLKAIAVDGPSGEQTPSS